MEFLIAIVALLLGAGGGFLVKREVGRKQALEIEANNERKIREAERKIHENEKKASAIISDAKDEANKFLNDAKDEARSRLQEIEKREIRLEQSEKNLDQKVNEVQKQKEDLQGQTENLQEKEKELDGKIAEQTEKLEKVAKMKKDDALALLLENVEKTHEEEILRKGKILDGILKETADEKAKNVIAQAIQKMSADVTSESTVTAVEIPSDEMKGRIIGREGRNINAIERFTGVDVIVDDTPNAITVSGFDLTRRFIAQKSIERLIADGRIHPARIEEVVQKVTGEVEKMTKDLGEKAIFEAGITGLPTEMAKILGRLRFRTSYGQNVLQHSVEVAFIAEAIASEIGADSNLAKKAGLLHDIGKAVGREVAGKHALIGAEICRKFKLSDSLINAVEAHHEDTEMQTPEAFIVAAADAISAARPGARKETVENFLRRISEIENIASGFDGVSKCFAIQAGREIRIIVDPEKISDLDASKLAKKIAKKIEENANYPGEIKVLVLRETRSEEIAR